MGSLRPRVIQLDQRLSRAGRLVPQSLLLIGGLSDLIWEWNLSFCSHSWFVTSAGLVTAAECHRMQTTQNLSPDGCWMRSRHFNRPVLKYNSSVSSLSKEPPQLVEPQNRFYFVWSTVGRIDSFPQSNCINSSGQHSLQINNSSESQATTIISKSSLKCNLSALNHFWLVCSDIITVIVTGVVTCVYLSDHVSTARPLPPQWSVQAHRKFSRLEDWSQENRLLDVSKNQETDGVQQQRDHNQLLICRVEFEKSGHLGILGSDFLARPVLVSSQ